MTSAFDVVAYVRERLPGATQMQQHKLAYYGQAWATTWGGRPLFHERVEAWQHGPVIPEVWRAARDGVYVVTQPLDYIARGVMDAVIDFYGFMTGTELRNLTHRESPWLDARQGLQPGQRSDEEIAPDQMRRYYTLVSMTGAKTPLRPEPPIELHREPPLADIVEVARKQNARWSTTLDWLADR